MTLSLGPFLASYFAIGALTLFLAILHLLLFCRLPRKRRPESLAFLWLGLMCVMTAIRAYTVFHRYQADSIAAQHYWQQWHWPITSLLICLAILYYEALLDRWPGKLGKALIAINLGIVILRIFSPGLLVFNIIQTPHPLTTSWGESLWVSSPQITPFYYILVATAFASIGIGIHNGWQLFRKRHRSGQGTLVLLTCAFFVLAVFFTLLTDARWLPPISLLDHSLTLFLIAMTIAVTDSAFKSNTALQGYEDVRNQLLQLVQMVPGVPYQLLVPDDGSPTRVHFVSPRLTELFGIPIAPLEELLARIGACMEEDERTRWQQALAQVKQNSGFFDYTGKLRRPDGKLIWFRAQSNTAPVPDGVIHSGILIDISNEMQTEQEKNVLLKELNLRNQELESVMYSATHDMRTPLVNLECFSKELQLALESIRNGSAYAPTGRLPDAWLESELADPIARLQDNSRRISRRLSALLTLTRSGRSLILIKPGDPLAVLRSAIQHLNEPIRIQQARLELPASLPNALFDRSQLFEVFRFILENALQFRHPERLPHIVCLDESTPAHLVLRIRDNGIGFSPQYSEIIFANFHQLHPGTPGAGEGIGLSMARIAMTRMQGSLKAEGHPGEGAAFILELPRN